MISVFGFGMFSGQVQWYSLVRRYSMDKPVPASGFYITLHLITLGCCPVSWFVHCIQVYSSAELGSQAQRPCTGLAPSFLGTSCC
jgi:hypothetical protein